MELPLEAAGSAARPGTTEGSHVCPEQSTDALVAAGVRTYVPNYAPKPVVFDHGEGSRLWDIDGREYVDLGTGISVNSFGHRHPELMAAITAQVSRFTHVSNLYYAEATVRLAEEMAGSTFAERVFFCNSGAEANEAAIKIVRKHASDAGRGPEEREIITFEGLVSRTHARDGDGDPLSPSTRKDSSRCRAGSPIARSTIPTRSKPQSPIGPAR